MPTLSLIQQRLDQAQPQLCTLWLDNKWHKQTLTLKAYTLAETKLKDSPVLKYLLHKTHIWD